MRRMHFRILSGKPHRLRGKIAAFVHGYQAKAQFVQSAVSAVAMPIKAASGSSAPLLVLDARHLAARPSESGSCCHGPVYTRATPGPHIIEPCFRL
jgi:hypothetical protein